MNGRLGAEENSRSQLEWRRMFFFPVQGRQLRYLQVGRGRQSFQNVFKVGVRFDAVHAAVFDQGGAAQWAPRQVTGLQPDQGPGQAHRRLRTQPPRHPHFVLSPSRRRSSSLSAQPSRLSSSFG